MSTHVNRRYGGAIILARLKMRNSVPGLYLNIPSVARHGKDKTGFRAKQKSIRVGHVRLLDYVNCRPFKPLGEM